MMENEIADNLKLYFTESETYSNLNFFNLEIEIVMDMDDDETIISSEDKNNLMLEKYVVFFITAVIFCCLCLVVIFWVYYKKRFGRKRMESTNSSSVTNKHDTNVFHTTQSPNSFQTNVQTIPISPSFETQLQPSNIHFQGMIGNQFMHKNFMFNENVNANEVKDTVMHMGSISLSNDDLYTVECVEEETAGNNTSTVTGGVITNVVTDSGTGAIIIYEDNVSESSDSLDLYGIVITKNTENEV